MRQSFFPKMMLMLGVSLVLAVAFYLRLTLPRPVSDKKAPAQATSTASTSAESGIPAFSSASFADGDPLSSLGPEWTLVRQQELSEDDGHWLDGTVPARESMVKLVGRDASLLLIELNIVDADKLAKALEADNVKPAAVAGRQGYLVPMNDIAGGNAFALTGDGRALLIQHGQSFLWPQENDLGQEVRNYVANVRMP